MNQSNFASITYSKELAGWFKEAEWWYNETGDMNAYILLKGKGRFPALTIQINVSMRDSKEQFTDKSLANALSKLMLYLIKEGLIKGEK